ncbi:nucleotidyltransferase domain-containing protein [Nocardiopsis gilva YIM 90087]|uniref:Nucleotidyltransferase domain-containing protein n=1 Tax=Nocardiopsis gilva YIM 90087 TaxID=1235441 RepID=A0A223S804_9ACTN|nr:DUF427 domain-containing protein [Nocardiopsis gilva]ASU84250.1 nucleotidyltransferase domain-containing protein [Nocardiopsis gilva YIM 90087]
MIRAVWNGVVLAEAERTVSVEGNHYFPPDSLRREYFTDGSTRTLCPWKGVARYYDVTVEGQTYADAAWYYPNPTPLARKIRGYVAFWPGVGIERVETPADVLGSTEHGAATNTPKRSWWRSLLGREA